MGDMTSMVVLDRGALRLHQPDDGTSTTITSADAANRQPTWSPDGRYLAWSRYDRRSSDAPAKLAVYELNTQKRRDFDVVFPAFYLHWRPDGRVIAALGDGPLGLELTTVDVQTKDSTILARGGPLYFDWHGDGTLLANIGSGDDRKFEYHGPADASAFNAHTPATFTAPARRPGTDEFIAAVMVDGVDRLVILSADGTVKQSLCAYDGYIRFAASPDGSKVAWVAGRPADQQPANLNPARLGARLAVTDQLVVHDLETDRVEIVCAKPPITFEWSPQSDKLLFLTVDDVGMARWMRWHIWSGGNVADYDWCRPSAVETREYLPFAEQHVRTQRRWSPDGTQFCYAGTALSGTEGIWVQHTDRDEATLACTGQFAWWRP